MKKSLNKFIHVVQYFEIVYNRYGRLFLRVGLMIFTPLRLACVNAKRRVAFGFFR